MVEENFLKNLPKISEEAAKEMDKDLTLGRLHEALQSMENGWAPGRDRLPVELYKAFWAVIGQNVLEVLLESMKGGLAICMKAILTLLPKKRNLIYLKNWCPGLTTVLQQQSTLKSISLGTGGNNGADHSL